jgi:hypothetical protein
MKIIKKANGDNSLLITKSEWLKIGKNQGWKEAQQNFDPDKHLSESTAEQKAKKELARMLGLDENAFKQLPTASIDKAYQFFNARKPGKVGDWQQVRENLELNPQHTDDYKRSYESIIEELGVPIPSTT